MFLTTRRGANAPATILSVAALILCVAVAYYLVAVLPGQSGESTSSSSSSVMSAAASVMSTAASTPTPTSSPSQPFDQAAYDACINASTEAHNTRWAAACAQMKASQESAYLACINQGSQQSYCEAQFGGYQNIGANCTLSVARTNQLNLQYSAAKLACNAKYGVENN